MKAFSFPLLCSHQSKPCTHPLDYHRSSFLFCFSPRVPIQSIFISPSVPFTAAFISTRSLNLPQPLFYTPLRLFTSSLTSSVSLPPPVCHLSPFSFNLPFVLFPLTAPLPRFFPLLLAYFVCVSLFLFQHALAFTLSDALSPSILSKALYGPIKFCSLMSFPMLYTWAHRTVQVVQGRIQTHTHTQDGFNNVALKHVGVFKVCLVFVNLHLSLNGSLTHQRALSIHTPRQGTSFIITRLDSSSPRAHPRIASTKTACFFNSKQCKQAVSALY